MTRLGRSLTAALLVCAASAAGLTPVVAPVAAAATTTASSYPVGARTAATPIVSHNPDDGTPIVLDGRVQALAEVGTRIIVGGTFTQVRNARTSTVVPRKALFAYDKATGKLDPTFAPVLDGTVDALQATADGTGVYVAGTFKTVNGTARPWLARVDTTTGALVTRFSAGLNGRVMDLDLRGDTLYAIGWFTKARTLPLGGLAGLNALTGAPSTGLTLALGTPRAAEGIRTVNVTPDRSRMVITGNFDTVAGLSRQQIAVIDLTTSPATVRQDWATSTLEFSCTTCAPAGASTYVRDADLSADGRYVVVGTTFYYPGNGDSAMRFELGAVGTDLAPTWIHYTGTDTITALTVSPQGVVYIGGHFRWYGVTKTGPLPGRHTRWGLAALDADTGTAYEWTPTRERGYGVLAMIVTAGGDLVIGHDRTMVGGEVHSRLAMFPQVGGRSIPPSGPAALPLRVSRVSGTGVATELTFDGAVVTDPAVGSAPTLAGFRAGTMIGGRLVMASMDGFWLMEPSASGAWTRAGRVYVQAADWARVTAMAYQDETLYYTLLDDSRLYATSLNSDSLLADPYPTVVAGPGIGAGRDFRTARGMFTAAGQLYVAWNDGRLDRTPLPAGGRVDTSAAAVTVSGPAVDGQNWASALYGGAAPAAVPARVNLAREAGVTVVQSTEGAAPASRAIDGNRDGAWWANSTSSTQALNNSWITVDLGAVKQIDAIRIWPRTDSAGEWMANPVVYVSDTPITDTTPATFRLNGIPRPGTELRVGGTGRYVRILAPGLERSGLQVAELEVLAPPTP